MNFPNRREALERSDVGPRVAGQHASPEAAARITSCAGMFRNSLFPSVVGTQGDGAAVATGMRARLAKARHTSKSMSAGQSEKSPGIAARA